MSDRNSVKRRRRAPLRRVKAGLASLLLAVPALVVVGETLSPAPAGAATCASGFSQSGSTCTATLSYTGSLQTVTVPQGVTSLTISATGAQGGGSSASDTTPGTGGIETGTVAVDPGDVLNVVVGGNGVGNIVACCDSPPTGTGGYGGGGTSPPAYGGGGGGGGSFVFDGGTLLVAGGGGGGAGGSVAFSSGGFSIGALGDGGNGGGSTGGAANGGPGATGGTQTAPGAPVGTGACAGSTGSGPATSDTALGDGGAGCEFDTTSPSSDPSGAGGGGYFGGGGGSYQSGSDLAEGCGGGGGSGYMISSAQNVSTSTAALGENGGSVTLGYALSPPVFNIFQNVSFRVGLHEMYAIAVSGSPTPELTATGSLPDGLSFSTDPNPGKIEISGTAAPGSEGEHVIQLSATNSDDTVVSAINLFVDQAPQFSPGQTTAAFTLGTPASYTISTSGSFPSALTMVAKAFPVAGLTFTDNHNGTATISGIPTKAVTKTVCLEAKNVVLAKTHVITIEISP